MFTAIGAAVSAFLVLGVTLALLDGGEIAGPGVALLVAVLIGPTLIGRRIDKARRR
jgi:hypothetical protein